MDTVISMYVNDIILAENNIIKINSITNLLNNIFLIKNFRDLEIIRNKI